MTRLSNKASRRFSKSVGWLYDSPDPLSHTVNQILYGAVFQPLETSGPWTRIRCERDGYEGWLESADIAEGQGETPNAQVCVPSMPVYDQPDFKTAPRMTLPLNAAVTITSEAAQNGFLTILGGGFAYAKHMSHAPANSSPLEVARQFVGTPYAWGGLTYAGIDCSGLVQQSLWAVGMPCPRDTGPQWNDIGLLLEPDDAPQEGDLVFFPGHVGFFLDGGRLLHANATHMRCTIDPLGDVIDWVAKDLEKKGEKKEPLKGFKRLS